MGGKGSGHDSIFELICEAYTKASPDISLEHLPLSPENLKILERWIFIDKQRSKHFPKQTNKQTYNLWKRKFNLSDAQYYIDKRNCERLFGSLGSIDIDYENKLSIEAWDVYISLALAKGDIKTAAFAQEKKEARLDKIHERQGDALPIDSESKTYELNINIVAKDGSKIGNKKIDITNLQELPVKEIRDLATIVDIPEADIDTMSSLIDELDNNDK